MRHLILIFYTIIVFQTDTYAQEGSLQMQISSDTIYLGNALGVQYNIENLNGQFSAPDFERFDIVSGPNVSSQYSIVDGVTTQKASYSYVLVPSSVGTLTITSASLSNGQEEYTTEPITITVIENPDDVWQDYRVLKVATGGPIPASPAKPLSKQDSLKLKLKRLKAKKI